MTVAPIARMVDPYVSVVGTASASATQQSAAREVGRLLAERGYRLVCGGLGGIMAAACAGHRAGGGRPIGILPGTDRREGNEHLDVAIVTGLGNMRNALVVDNGDAVVAIGGRYGTLSELALALDAETPVVGIDTHDIEGVTAVADPEAAVDYVDDILGGQNSESVT